MEDVRLFYAAGTKPAEQADKLPQEWQLCIAGWTAPAGVPPPGAGYHLVISGRGKPAARPAEGKKKESSYRRAALGKCRMTPTI